MANENDTTPSGSQILRHEESDREFTAPEHSGRNAEAIEAHIEKHIGPVETVFHEVVSDLIHLDVHFIPATQARPYHVLVTSGVSELPMNVPEGAEGFERVELLIALPATWPLDQESFKNEDHYWPVRWLKYIGKLPHEYNTWIGWGHSIPNGDPAEPIANSSFVGAMLMTPYWLDPEFYHLESDTGDEIHFYDLVPLYDEEMSLKLKRGAEHIEELMDKKDVRGAVNPTRKNVAKSKWWSR